MITKQVFISPSLASPYPFVVPSDFMSLVSIECIGTGGIGTNTSQLGSGGGAYAGKFVATSGSIAGMAAGSTYPWNIAYTEDTYFDTTGTVLAKVGGTGDSVGQGGQAGSCVGDVTYSGGNGGAGFGSGGAVQGGGGGGAAGPNGAGADGGAATALAGGAGGQGGNGFGGAGAAGAIVSNAFPVANGASGREYGIYGSGGGGGGGFRGGYGGVGGNFGGGMGGGYNYPFFYGALGLIVFTYMSAITPVGCRQCRRLSEPSPYTFEQIGSGNLVITISMPFDLVNAYVSQIPNTGPDTLIVNYTDNLGQPGQFTRNVTLWCSDNGYVLLSADQTKQFLIASVNPTFWQSVATAINARNNTAAALALLPCCNADRYDANTLQPNQQVPSLFIYNGIQLAPASGSSSSSSSSSG